MESNLLEFRILSLLRQRDSYLKYSRLIKEELFESKETRMLFRLLKFYHKKGKSKQLATLSTLFTLVDSQVKETEQAKVKKAIRLIKKYTIKDASIADDVIKRFTTRQIVKRTIMDALHSLDHDENVNVSKLRERLDEALEVSGTDFMEDAYDYLSNPTQRLEQDKNEPRLATLFPAIDSSIRRGLAGGELAVAIAPTTVGKTFFLINITHKAMQQGKKVVFITLELSGKRIASRFDQLVTQKPIEYIEKHPSIVKESIKKLASKGGGLLIKDFVSARLTVEHLSVYLERVKKDFDVDLLVVDQIPLMHSPKEFREKRHELSSIVSGLRRLGASFNIPVWSAAQANRLAGESGETTLWDIAEDIGIGNWTDLIIALSQNREDKEDKIMHLEVVKNRIGAGNPRVTLELDYARMTMKEREEVEDNDDS